jgi:hypothetical protein
MIVNIRALNVSFFLTMVYGPTEDAGKPTFLEEL